METQNYNTQISVGIPVSQAIHGILNIKGWWAQDIDGAPKKIGDTFTVHFGNTWALFEVTALSANKMAWTVTDCYLDLLQNVHEWTGTSLLFDLHADKDVSVINITHQGLTPDKECFNDCRKGWAFYLEESLFAFLNKQQGQPGAGIHAWIDMGSEILKGKLYVPGQIPTEMKGDLLLLDVKQTKGEQVLAGYAMRSFSGEPGQLSGKYFMLMNNRPGLSELLQQFVNGTVN